MKLAAIGLAVSVTMFAADPAEACSLAFNEPVRGEAAPADVTPPEVGIPAWDIGWAPSEGTCADRAWLSITAQVADAASPVGLVIEVVDGNLSQDLFGTEPQRPGPSSGTDLHYYFDYDLAHVQATLHVRAVDLAGNRSEPRVIVIDAERSAFEDEDGGCAAGGSGAGFGGLMLVALALVGARRRSSAQLDADV